MRLAILLSTVFIGVTIAAGTPSIPEKPNRVRAYTIGGTTDCADCCPASGRTNVCCGTRPGEPPCSPCGAWNLPSC
ncbi:hypothetical protein PTMSG1_07184 [Pyrenophora teres f. maculata]|nr:hypothetical protein PTMSG1_07184 [Pyrenophora teres f. maculata]